MAEISERVAPSPLMMAVGQMHPVPGDVAANLATIETLVSNAVAEGARLVILPETATTGYFIADRLAELAETDEGPSSRRLGEIARKAGVHLAVGMAIRDGGSFFDAQLLFGPDGKRLATYRKAHLFSTERNVFAPGKEPMVVETSIGRIGMTICYDMIFPEYIRLLVDRGADLIINSTNWITDDFQRDRWGWSGDTVRGLAATRALENGIWLAMANCVGKEWIFDSIGHSCIVAPSGKVVANAGTGQGVAVAEAVFRSDDLDRWKSIATYLGDRRWDLY